MESLVADVAKQTIFLSSIEYLSIIFLYFFRHFKVLSIASSFKNLFLFTSSPSLTISNPYKYIFLNL